MTDPKATSQRQWHNPSDGDLPSYKRSASLVADGPSVLRDQGGLHAWIIQPSAIIEGEGTGWRAFPADAILGGERHFGRRLV